MSQENKIPTQVLKDAEIIDGDTVRISCNFSSSVTQSLLKYQKANGLPFTQDVIRIAVAGFLRKQGYIK